MGLLPKDHCKHYNLCVMEIKGSEEKREGKKEEKGKGWKEKNIHRREWNRKLKKQSMLRLGSASWSSRFRDLTATSFPERKLLYLCFATETVTQNLQLLRVTHVENANYI